MLPLLLLLLLSSSPAIKTKVLEHYAVSYKFNQPQYKLTGKEVYQYSNTGNLMEYSRYSGHTREISVRNVYTSSGQLFSSDTTFAPGTGTSYITSFTYDTTGLLLRKNAYTHAGKAITRTLYTYRSSGELDFIEQWSEPNTKDYLATHRYQYHPSGKVSDIYISILSYGIDFTTTASVQNTYDTTGRLIRYYYNSDLHTDIINYTPHGEIIDQYSRYDGTEETDTFKYNYDTLTGNPTQQFTYHTLLGRPKVTNYCRYKYTYYPSQQPHTKK